MKNKFSNLTNEELIGELNKNLAENDMIFQEILDREEDGRMKREYDPSTKAFIHKINSYPLNVKTT